MRARPKIKLSLNEDKMADFAQFCDQFSPLTEPAKEDLFKVIK